MSDDFDSSDPFPSAYDHRASEAACQARWEHTGIHRFDPDGEAEIFSVDTPPPYVSAAHLHVGHAMSYTQAEIVVRYHRMMGRRIHYPMGFDDNGLPTERYVQTVLGVDPAATTRAAFRQRCLEETRRGAAAYEALWRSMGLSVDWSLSYSTIDPHCRHTAQRSFLELLRTGRIYRADEPVIWDPTLQSALAQADLDTLTRRTKLHTVHFGGADRPLPIATTRPELLPACVALYHHPDDPRWQGLTTAEVPLFDRTVPVRSDRDIDPDFGSGLMMVCTFGDAEDVRRWKRDGLHLRTCIGRDGRLTEAAGPYSGQAPTAARSRIVADLAAAGAHGGFTMTEQAVPIGERSGTPVEWVPAPQWFLRTLDLEEALLERSAELRWHPEWMKPRLDAWITGLKWDWNLSRQRSYGVPIPMWLCTACAHPVPAEASQLPVDPLEDPPPTPDCPRCGGELQGDPDVLDTWMTSSLTPQINANWVGSDGRTGGPRPQTVRVQGHEIIRTWLFSSLLKSHLHHDALPWRDVMISGWGLNEQGRKISKRDLQKTTDPSGFNRYDPAQLIDKYGADAVRHWAARSQLGHDLRYHEKQVRSGRKTVLKLWNVGRLAHTLLAGFDAAAPRMEVRDRPPEDRDVLHHLDRCTVALHEGLMAYDPASALADLDRTLFSIFCDDWLETLKDRVYRADRHPPTSTEAGQATLYEGLRTLLGLYAPFVPFVTEAVWQRLYASAESAESLHITTYPTARGLPAVRELQPATAVLRVVRQARTQARLPQSREVHTLTLQAAASEQPGLRALFPTLRAACRAENIDFGDGELAVTEGLRVTIRFADPPTDQEL